MAIALAAVACVLLFSFAIFVHEFGHFLAARLLGMKVDAFSIGFGPALWRRTWGGVEYRIGAIPFGGYVALPQLDPEGTDALQGGKSKGRRLGEIPAWKRAVVALAGPFGNVVLAVVLAFALAAAPGARFRRVAPVVGMAAPGGAAEKAGLKEGDRILSADGREIKDWNGLSVAAALSGGRSIRLEVKGAKGVRSVDYAPPRNEALDAHYFDAKPSPPAVVGKVLKGMPAEKAGLKEGDEIVSVGDRPVDSFSEVRMLFAERGPGEVEIGVRRDGATMAVKLETVWNEKAKAPVAGFLAAEGGQTAPWMVSRNPAEQLAYDAGQIFRVLKGLVTPKETKATAGALGGPVMIAQVLYRQVRRDFWDAIGFLRFLNVNLAVLNLLPIPVLDGGLILFALFELVARRKVPRRVVNGLSMAFMWLFLGLMVLLVFKDVSRSRRLGAEEERAERILRERDAAKEAAENFRPAFRLKGAVE